MDAEGRLTSLPLLAEGYVPDTDRLPAFVLSLGRDVDWESEKPCFHTLADALAEFYSLKPPCRLLPEPASGEGRPPGDDREGAESAVPAREDGAQEMSDKIKHVLLPAMRRELLPPRERATDGTVLQVACLERLYRIFERC